ncbi:calcium/sodium antiporter [Tropicimonas sp. IMCC6043]|uniref:calcium/sodium antiporter n=1 Tax=Tropicimonas sp. IMCC6043 TaxID=2510645 RepID=UPI00101C7B0B|nr:calcium/sodium antiporter [Tropicimonas sp. IMCC6043]RYH08292.1 calcium/sodium antiporter [Tropicimonas sp. IMCC6043]
MDLLFIAAGLAGLFFGGDRLVAGAVGLAHRAGLPPLVIGLTIVGFGTSTPELLTSLRAAFLDSPGIAIGNVVGSNIANILLILGLAALVAPMAVERRALLRDGPALALATLAGAALIWIDMLGRTGGLILLGGLATYLAIALRAPGPDDSAPTEEAAAPARLFPAVGQFALGLVATLIGAHLLVTGGISLARSLAVPETIIGLTIVAVGTSLPELATSLIAARRGHAEVAIGNVIGSNIFNLLGILGATAAVSPISAPPGTIGADLAVMLGATALLLWVAATDRRISRREGAILLGLYVGYILWLALRAA